MLAFRDPDSLKAGNLHNHIAAWGILQPSLPMTSLLSFTLNRLLLNNFKLVLLRNRQLQSFQIRYCYFLATWRRVSYCLISLLPKCLLSLVTKLSSNVYFTLGTVQEIWALSKPPRLPIFRMTVVFCLITSGEKPCAMAPQICSECVVIQIQPYARFGLLKCMSLCQERLVLTFPGVTCSGLQIKRSPRLSTSHQFHGRISFKAVSSTS